MDDVRMNMGLNVWEHLERTRHSGRGSDGGSQPSQGVETGTGPVPFRSGGGHPDWKSEREAGARLRHLDFILEAVKSLQRF